MKHFTGTVAHQLDGKNRIRIPKKFRSEFPEGERLYFMRYTKGCIAVFGGAALEERLEALKEIKSDRPDLQLAKRVVLSSVEEIEEDAQGRTVLSQNMREYAGIAKDVVTIGMGDYLEIWSPERLKEVENEMPLDVALGKIAF